MSNRRKLTYPGLALIMLALAGLACIPLEQLAGGFETPTPAVTTAPNFQVDVLTPLPEPTSTQRAFVLPPPPSPTPLPAIPTPAYPWLTGEVAVYPGPRHYEGDILTFELRAENLAGQNGIQPRVWIDGVELADVPAVTFISPWEDGFLVLPQVWDTTGQAGWHDIVIELEPMPPLQFAIEVLPAERLPPQERAAEWRELVTDCCRLYYLTHTPAERDLEAIVETVEEAVADVELRLDREIAPKPVPITLIDNVWGHGAFASTGSGVVISYVDRPYNGLDLETVVRHEATHWATFPLNHGTPTLLVEGLAVYVAGGHFKPEPIPARAAALLALDRYVPLADLANDFRGYQHEIAYLEAGGLIYWLASTYGRAQLLTLYSLELEADSPAEWLDEAVWIVYGLTLDEVETAYLRWLEGITPGGQVDDLRLTLELYELLRRYQYTYAPFQMLLPTAAEAAAGDRVGEFLREPTNDINYTIETMMLNAQTALRDGRYAEAEELIGQIDHALTTGDFSVEPTVSYLQIANLFAAQGYEPLQIVLDGEQAYVLATRDRPRQESFLVYRDAGGRWQIGR
ncbi:MAG: hypothetical protein Kow00124_11330 [Anaerolineae bacterium]